jgi:RNA polymerase-associated protein RTF1
MADIDDELLALAGDASSDEEGEEVKDISRDNSASPDRRASGKAGTKKSTGRKTKRRNDDSEEEGEA